MNKIENKQFHVLDDLVSEYYNLYHNNHFSGYDLNYAYEKIKVKLKIIKYKYEHNLSIGALLLIELF